jgi:hypothetical protein
MLVEDEEGLDPVGPKRRKGILGVLEGQGGAPGPLGVLGGQIGPFGLLGGKISPASLISPIGSLLGLFGKKG